MSSANGTSDDWEYSKENIQPIQQGRKPQVLKFASYEQPDHMLQEQRQAFENELRTYSGDDPLSVWCKYIHWVEQNFLKGGRDGHLEELVRKCVKFFKDETRYYSDKRFIAIWLKFANASIKPIEVFNYMYSNNIGVTSMNLYKAWSWELEQNGNVTKANQVLQEGINRKADPIDALKSYYSEFRIRAAKEIMQGDHAFDSENHRSAFTLLKSQRNVVPVNRIGDSVIEQNKSNMLIGRQQPAAKVENSAPKKVPFKIYNSDKPLSSLPVQSKGTKPFTFYTDSRKENELKPSKWNKVKVKQMLPASRPMNTDPGFDFHCDDTPQPVCTPKLVPKFSSALRSRQGNKSPEVALFEPPDPMKRSDYDKNKVYGGAEEFSLEEIKAAAWLKKFGTVEGESESLKFPERKSFMIHSDKKISDSAKFFSNNKNKAVDTADYPRALMSPVNPLKHTVYDRNKVYNGTEEFSLEELRAFAWEESYKKTCEEQRVELLQQQVLSLKKQLEQLQNQSSTPNDSKCSVKSEYLKEGNISANKNQSKSIEQCSNLQQQSQINPCLQGVLKTDCSDLLKLDLSNDKGRCKQGTNSQPSSPNRNRNVHASKIMQLLDTRDIQNLVKAQQHEIKFELDHQMTKDSIGNCFSTSHFTDMKQSHEQRSKMHENISGDSISGTPSITDILCGKQLVSTSFCEAQDMVQQLYNGTLGLGAVMNEYAQAVRSAGDTSQSKDNDSLKHASASGMLEVSNKFGLPFTFYQDPTETAPIPKHKGQGTASNNKILPVPFTLYQDPTEVVQSNILFMKTPQTNEAGDENLPTNDEDAENVPPKDFVQEVVKREVSGILTPALNVLYVPLEEQEDECSDEEDICTEENRLLPNDTLMMPCNTEHFVSAPFYSSTPCTSAKNGKRQNLLVPMPSDTYNYSVEPYNAASESNVCPPQGAVDNTVSRQALRSVNPIRACNLSVIIETSKESYKSSASSGSSASVTKLSQFDHGYSYDKSNITHNKEFSKVDTFKEPKPVDQDYNFSSVKKAIDDVSEETDGKKPKEIELYRFDDDPFDKGLSEKLLQSLEQHYHSALEVCDKNFRNPNPNGSDSIEINGVSYLIKSKVGKGAYGKVFVVDSSSQNVANDSHKSSFALKACKGVNEWELYVCSILHKRLHEIKGMLDVSQSVMSIISAKKYRDGMVMITEYCRRGTLVDLVNLYKAQNTPIPQYLILYFSLEMLQTMAEIHRCQIIHADIKADNILVRDFPIDLSLQDCLDQNISFLKFIDFGRAIDLRFFKEGICFTTPLKICCAEVLENKPWVFQPDWCGILDCIHTLLFSEYMKVKKTADGRWAIEKKFPRYWPKEVWTPLFDELLNLPACYQEPKISEHVSRIKNKLLQNAQAFQNNLRNIKM